MHPRFVKIRSVRKLYVSILRLIIVKIARTPSEAFDLVLVLQQDRVNIIWEDYWISFMKIDVSACVQGKGCDLLKLQVG